MALNKYSNHIAHVSHYTATLVYIHTGLVDTYIKEQQQKQLLFTIL